MDTSSTVSSSTVNPLVQPQPANTPSPSSTSNSASQPDFNSHMEAATQASTPAAAAPAAAAQTTAAPTAPPAPADGKGSSPKDGATSDASDDSTESGLPPKTKAAASSTASTPDPMQWMNQIVASALTPATATIPAAETPATPATPTAAAPSADGTSKVAASVTTSAAALFAAATAAGVPLTTTATAPSTPSSTTGAKKASPLSPSTPSSLTASSLMGENNAATPLFSGIKVPVETAPTSVSALPDAPNKDSNGAKSQNSEKNDPNSPNSTLSPAQDSLSGNLGTLFSGIANMPAIAQNLPTLATATLPADKSAAATPDVLAALTSLTPVSSKTASVSAGAPADAGLTATATAASLNGTNFQNGVTEKSVTLDSNQQFVDVIKQALDQQPLQTPQRIAVELQTPPGQTVTVFFSQSSANGQIRAQLSASDSGSLQWLQQQVGSLKEINGGSSIVWLPPQLDHSNSDQGQQGRSGQQAHSQSQYTPQQPQQNTGNDADMDDRALAEAIFGGADLNSTLAKTS